MRRLCVLALVACGASSRPAAPPPPPPPAPIVAAVTPPPVEELEYLDTTLATLARDYVDPQRFDYRRMLRGAVEAIESDVAEVIADISDDKVAIRVNADRATFAGDTDSLAELGLRLTEIVHFVQQHANPSTEAGSVELSAVNGMLHTLDPHTRIIDANELRDWEVGLRGTFAGIGIVMHLAPYHGADRLAIDKVTPSSPAERAGLKAGDTIVAIDGQSTEAFTLDEGMNRLRGAEGTPVQIAIDRGGTTLEKAMTRAEVEIPAVESRMLDRSIGYVYIDRFSEHTAADLERALTKLRAAGARGWVLDLRENTGGLLMEAVRAADLFVDSGTIVATVAGGRKVGVKTATPGGIDTRSPLVVLIGSRTASAAEILAGALKQLDRAVLVGRTTFGKGSVQILAESAHGGKLKITTAEYVAANDISVQASGIAPDIELVPAQVPKQLASDADVLQLVPPAPFREIDLGAHLTTEQRIDRDKPVASVAYAGDDDFEIRFARTLAAAAPAARTRRQLLHVVAGVVARVDGERTVTAALQRLAIDWQRGAATTAPALDLRLTAPKLTAGEVARFDAEIANTGAIPAFRVHARASSEDPIFDGLELVFGAVAPNATRRATAFVRVPNGSASRASAIHWLVSAEVDRAPKHVLDATTDVVIAGKPYPSFALSAQLVEVVRRGAEARIRVHLTNRGPGRSSRPRRSRPARAEPEHGRRARVRDRARLRRLACRARALGVRRRARRRRDRTARRPARLARDADRAHAAADHRHRAAARDRRRPRPDRRHRRRRTARRRLLHHDDDQGRRAQDLLHVDPRPAEPPAPRLRRRGPARTGLEPDHARRARERALARRAHGVRLPQVISAASRAAARSRARRTRRRHVAAAPAA